MVTGDNLNTAKAIARECGILTDGEAIEGPVFRDMNINEMRKLIPKLQVKSFSCPQVLYLTLDTSVLPIKGLQTVLFFMNPTQYFL